MNVERVQENNEGVPMPGASLAAEESLSALMDNELADQGVGAVLELCHADAEWSARCSAYQLIGDVLRGSRDVLPRQEPSSFLQAVKAGLDAPVKGSSAQTRPAPAAQAVEEHGLGASHEVRAAQVAVAPEAVVAGGRAVRTVRGEAANSPVLRWKLVAGLASVVAVMAISWGVLQQATPEADGTGASQLARNTPAEPATLATPAGGAPGVVISASEGSNPGGAVVVATGQGQLIRDARLEQLLAEHRQYGGMSALQMPAGFLRNATYDAAPSR